MKWQYIFSFLFLIVAIAQGSKQTSAMECDSVDQRSCNQKKINEYVDNARLDEDDKDYEDDEGGEDEYFEYDNDEGEDYEDGDFEDGDFEDKDFEDGDFEDEDFEDEDFEDENDKDVDFEDEYFEAGDFEGGDFEDKDFEDKDFEDENDKDVDFEAGDFVGEDDEDGYPGVWHEYNCEAIFSSSRPIHNQSTWMLLRGVYAGVVGPESSTISTLSHGNGFHKPFHAKISAGKGRGIFAAGPVQKGDLIWSAIEQSARFETGEKYREFLAALPVDLACDVIQWAYVQSFGDDEEFDDDYEDYEYIKSNALICVDLDECSFMNGDGWEEGEDANVGFISEAGKLLPGGSKNNYFALRDIDAGEEFLVSYWEFAFSQGWRWFGLHIFHNMEDYMGLSPS